MEMMVAAVRSRDAQQRHLAGGHIGGPVRPPTRRRPPRRRIHPVRGVRSGLSRAFLALGRALAPPPCDRAPAGSATS